MDLELWHLILLPLIFAAGWWSRGMERSQMTGAPRDVPERYSRGVRLLLANRQDKAIDCFIRITRVDPDHIDLYFVLGELFRNRGEFGRAIRVHQSVADRTDLPQEVRVRALHALAEDYMKAGLYDRAERTYHLLRFVPTEHFVALRALLQIYIIRHEWVRAIDTARALMIQTGQDYTREIAHYYCELADTAIRMKDYVRAKEYTEKALRTFQGSPRPFILLGSVNVSLGDVEAAKKAWLHVLAHYPEYIPMVVIPLVDLLCAQGKNDRAVALIEKFGASTQCMDQLDGVMNRLLKMTDEQTVQDFSRRALEMQPTLSGYNAYLLLQRQLHPEDAMTQLLSKMIQRYTRRLSRYQCSKCGFLASTYAWGCLSCGAWDCFPLQKSDQMLK